MVGQLEPRVSRFLEPGLLYFAYGCNMDKDVLSGVLGREPALGHPARADGWRLTFNKGGEGENGAGVTANLIEEAGSCVYGVVYGVPQRSMKRLDEFEGVPEHYRRATLWVCPEGRRARQAVVAYLGQPTWIVAAGRPAADYLESLLRGALAQGLPADYVEWLGALGRGETGDGYAAARR